MTSRRGFFGVAGGLLAAAGTRAPASAAPNKLNLAPAGTEPFWGPHQAGIVTPQQSHCYFSAFDLTTEKRDDIILLLRAWTDAAARLTQGQAVAPDQL